MEQVEKSKKMKIKTHSCSAIDHPDRAMICESIWRGGTSGDPRSSYSQRFKYFDPVLVVYQKRDTTELPSCDSSSLFPCQHLSNSLKALFNNVNFSFSTF